MTKSEKKKIKFLAARNIWKYSEFAIFARTRIYREITQWWALSVCTVQWMLQEQFVKLRCLFEITCIFKTIFPANCSFALPLFMFIGIFGIRFEWERKERKQDGERKRRRDKARIMRKINSSSRRHNKGREMMKERKAKNRWKIGTHYT